MKKTIVLLSFIFISQYLFAQIKHPELNFLVGNFETKVLLPSPDGNWVEGGKGTAKFYPILDGTFIREDLNLTFGQGTLTMSNSIGKDGRSKKFRMIAMDKEYSVMDVYTGKVEADKLILDNINSDLPFVTANGDSISFRLTYSKVSDNENQSLVEMTKDGGKTWIPYSKQRFIRKKEEE